MKLLILLFVILLGATLQAQITLTAANHHYQIGDTVRYYGVVPSSPLYYATGTNQNWVISGSNNPVIVANKQVNPATTIDASFHPAATLAGVDLRRDSSISYNQITGNDYYFTGTLSLRGRVVYEDPSLYMRYPMSYQDVHNDIFYGSGTTFMSTGPFNYRRGGQSKVEATGYGTLQLPTGTLMDVLQVTYTTSYSDTMIGFSTPFANYKDTIHFWYSNLSRYPVASYTKGYIIRGLGTPSMYSSLLQYADVSALIPVTQINALKAEINLFPNPTTDQLTIEGLPTGSTLTVTNAQGQQVIDVEGPTDKTHQLSTQDLPAGVYWLTIRVEHAQQTKLFVVQ